MTDVCPVSSEGLTVHTPTVPPPLSRNSTESSNDDCSIPSKDSVNTLSKEESDVNVDSRKDVNSYWQPIPEVAEQSLRRKFNVDLPNIEVTSLDMTPHGCFVVAGCSNGMVLLFDLTSSSKHGTLVGHIRAKGMHTNLILTVKITEDSRFAFAGCLKGSMEMLSVDMGQIPIWKENSAELVTIHNKNCRHSALRSASHAPTTVRTFTHLDPKLRGFGAVSRLKCQEQTVEDEKYVLICGKGIKSVHVWLFTPPKKYDSCPAPHPLLNDKIGDSPSGVENATAEVGGGPVWTFLFDVATNGVTIEVLGFRFKQSKPSMLTKASSTSTESTHNSPGFNDVKVENTPINSNGEDTNASSSSVTSNSAPQASSDFILQMLSKSRGMCVRVWDLVDLDRDMSEENEADFGKLPYEDIPNSNDCRLFSDDGELAFGGLYNFSVMRMDAPKWANRETYEVPARCIEDDTGQRRRRLMREINEVIACHDGNHVLALCTDGGVLYYQYERLSSCDDVGNGVGSLIEFQKLTKEVEIGPEFMTDDSWAIKRVGKSGAIVLIRASKELETEDGEGRGAVVDISLLSDLAPETVSHTSASKMFNQRNKGLCYHDNSLCHDIDKPQVHTTSALGKPPSGRHRKKAKEKRKESGGAEGDTKVHSSTPREKKIKTASSTPGKYSTPVEVAKGVKKQGQSGKRNAALNISPQDNVQVRDSGGGASISKRLYAPTPTKRSSRKQDEAEERKSTRKRHLSIQVTSPVTQRQDELSSCSKRVTNILDNFSPKYEITQLPLKIPHPGEPPRVKKIKFVPYSGETTVKPAATHYHPLLIRFQQMKEESWAQLTNSAFVAGIHLCDSTFLTKIGPNSRQTAELLLLEQDRLYQLFMIEFLRGLEKIIAEQTVDGNVVSSQVGIRCQNYWRSFGDRYREIVTDIMKSQMVQIKGAISKDNLLSGSSHLLRCDYNFASPMLRTNTSSHDESTNVVSSLDVLDSYSDCGDSSMKPWSFVHCGMFTIAEGIVHSVEKMIKTL